MSTDEDLTTFRDRVKEALAERSSTQKAFEDDNDLTAGTLTRIFGGRKKLDEETLLAIAAGLDLAPEALIAGTALGEDLVLSDDVADPTEDVADATDDVADATDDVADATEDVADATDDVADATDNVTQPTDEAASRPAPEEPSDPPEDDASEHASRLRRLPVIGAIVGGVVAAGTVIAKALRRRK